jgi:hypothetical protein
MKGLRYSVLLVLGLVLATGAFAGDLAPVALPAPVCDAPSTASALLVADAAQPPAAPDLFTPEPLPLVCPLIGCANDQYCRRDRDCTTAPGGVCNLFCPTRGCCAYP